MEKSQENKEGKMTDYCVFDTEDDSKGNFKLGVLKSNKGYMVFKDCFFMGRFIVENFRTAYAHNIGYDLGNIFKDDIGQLKYSYSGSRIIKATYSNNGCWCVFLDTMNLCPMSLKKIGDSLGLKKLNMKKDDLEKYCRRDVQILDKFLIEYFRITDELGIKCGYTLGMNGLKYFRKLNPELELRQNKYNDIVRLAYYGGRVEIFRHGRIKGIIVENDINSLYPSVMVGINLPDWNNIKFTKNKNKLNYEGVSYCHVQSNLKVPLLPYRMRGEVLIFPNGTFWGTWTHVELREFLKAGGKVLKFVWTVYSNSTISDIFNSYVKKLYDMRIKTDKPYKKMIFKLMLNSLYGKFGYRGEREELVKYNEKTGIKPDENIILGKKRMYVLSKRIIKTGYQNPMIASYITARARIVLWKLLVKHENSLIYCDTDSLYTTEKIVKKTDKLGELSERNIYNGGEFVLPKLYRAGNTYKSKGMKIKNGKEWKEFRKTGKHTDMRPIKIKTSLKFGKNVNVWKKVTKKSIYKYDKRIVVKGGTTIPITLFY